MIHLFSVSFSYLFLPLIKDQTKFCSKWNIIRQCWSAINAFYLRLVAMIATAGPKALVNAHGCLGFIKLVF